MLPLTLVVLFAVATSAGDARRQQAASQCRPSTTLAPRVATIERPTLSVEQNQFFVISLGSNPSTGYHWIVGQAKPYPFGIVGTTTRDGVAVASTQPQYDQYGRPYAQQQQYAQPQYDQYGRPYAQSQYGQQYSQYGQTQPTAGAGSEQLLILKATAPAGVETLEMHYVPANVTTIDARRGPVQGEVTRQFTIEVTPPAYC